MVLGNDMSEKGFQRKIRSLIPYLLPHLCLSIYYINICLGVVELMPNYHPVRLQPEVMAGYAFGAVFCSLILPPVLARLAKIPAALPPLKAFFRQWPLVFIILPCVLVRLACRAVYSSGGAFWFASSFTIGMTSPLVLTLYFNQIPHASLGLALSMALAPGWIVWSLFVLDPGRTYIASLLGDWCGAVFYTKTLALALTGVLILIDTSRFRNHLVPKCAPGPPDSPEETVRRRNIVHIIVGAFLYFLTSGMLDAQLFPAIPPERLDHHPPQVLIALAIVYPLLGRLLDQKGQRGFRALMFGCSLLFLFLPSLMALGDLPGLRVFIHDLGIIGQLTVLMALMAYMAPQIRRGPWFCLVFNAVFLVRSGSYLIAWTVRQLPPINTGLVYLASTCAAILFLVVLREVGPAPAPDKPETPPAPEPDGIALAAPPTETEAENPEIMFDRYTLSPREREVAALLLKGGSSRDISIALGISEYTVKAHVRNILAKSGVTTRKAFMALMIDLKKN